MKHQSIWGLRALLWHQFRNMKWVLILNLLVCAVMCYILQNMFTLQLDEAWSGRHIGENSYMGLNAMVGVSFLLTMVWLLMIAPLTSLAQQWEANQPRNALMMASLPPTQGAHFSAQLISGALCYTLPLICLGVFAAACRAVFGSELAQFTKMTPFARSIAEQDTLMTILTSLLRIWLLVTSVYALTTLVASLYGNLFVSLAMLGGLVLWAVVLANTLYDYCRYVGALFYPDKPSVIHTAALYALRSVLGVEVDQSLTNGALLRMPWQGLGIFAAFHILVGGACVACAYRARERLAVESLGSVFLFKASRIAMVCALTLWPLHIVPYYLVTWTDSLERQTYNPWFPLALIPALLVFAVGWLVLVRGHRRRRAAVAAMLCVALLGGSGMGGVARAEGMDTEPGEVAFGKSAVFAQYAPERLMVDRDMAERCRKLSAALAEELLSHVEDTIDMAYYDDKGNVEDWFRGHPGEGASLLANVVASSSANNTLGLYDIISLYQHDSALLDARMLPNTPLIEAFVGVLDKQGYPALAKALRNANAESASPSGASDSIVYENGVWLCTYDLYTKDFQSSVFRRGLIVKFSASFPLGVRGKEVLMAAIEQSSDMRRILAYSNGDVGTVVYDVLSLNNVNMYMYSCPRLTLTMEGDKTRAWLMIPAYNANDEALCTAAFAALSRVMTSGMSVSDADAQVAAEAMAKLVKDGSSGRHSGPSLQWNVKRAGWFGGKGYRISVETE